MPQTAKFDSLILATDADNAITILGKQASQMGRRVLGGVKYLHDPTITHIDADYMNKVALFIRPHISRDLRFFFREIILRVYQTICLDKDGSC